MSNLPPIFPSPFSYVTGLSTQYGSVTTLTVSAGQARDSTDTFDIILPAGVTLNAANNGLNGLDQGTLAASTMYAVYVVADSANYNPTGVILSLSSTPTLPFGYGGYQQIGWWATNGSTQFFIGYVTGGGTSRRFWYDTKQNVLSGGSQITTYAAVSLANIVPAVALTPVLFEVSFTAASAGNFVSLKPTGSAATSVQNISSVATTNAQVEQALILSNLAGGLPEVSYVNSASSCATTLNVTGFDFFI